MRLKDAQFVDYISKWNCFECDSDFLTKHSLYFKHSEFISEPDLLLCVPIKDFTSAKPRTGLNISPYCSLDDEFSWGETVHLDFQPLFGLLYYPRW